MMSVDNVKKKAKSVKEASGVLYNCSSKKKNALLNAITSHLRIQTPSILNANRKDLAVAAASGLSEVLTDRLTLNEKRIEQMVNGVNDIMTLKDPVGSVVEKIKRPNGLLIEKMRVPLGAVGNYLRVAAERDNRRCSALLEIRQCSSSPRRF